MVKPFFPVHLCVLAASIAILFASCASSPKSVADAEAAGGGLAFLDPGGLVYLTLDVPGSRPVLDRISLGGMRGSQAGQALDMTDTAAAAVYPPGDGRGFLLAAQGRYPNSRLRFLLGVSSAWKKTRSTTGGRYWRSETDNLSIYIDPRYALLSGGDPFPRSGGVMAPPRFAELREGAVLAGWVPDAAAMIDRLLFGMQIPLSIPAGLAVFGVYPAAADPPDGEGRAANPAHRFFARIRLELPSPSHAGAIAAMIALIRSVIVNPAFAEAGEFSLAPLLFANPLVQDGSSLILRTADMDAEEIALLFTMFSIYSN
ncbi:MAG: hypothetical protein LBH70_08225 [Spirochaetaceae bacterium]|jgi:hypothetical protein|nr:hypothetical protein [Spirochaetaceae bacterium]